MPLFLSALSWADMPYLRHLQWEWTAKKIMQLSVLICASCLWVVDIYGEIVADKICNSVWISCHSIRSLLGVFQAGFFLTGIPRSKYSEGIPIFPATALSGVKMSGNEKKLTDLATPSSYDYTTWLYNPVRCTILTVSIHFHRIFPWNYALYSLLNNVETGTEPIG